MRTFSINTLGCKVNQYEGQQIRELLEGRGLRQAQWPQEPDLVVVHTCCVTRTASAKSRQCIRKVLKQNPQSLVLVSGCLPAAQTGELSSFAENVHLVANQSDLASALTLWAENNPIKAQNGREIKRKNPFTSESQMPLLTSFDGHTRAFLKVQDGCDGYCTYCIVPRTRPIVRSKPLDAVIHEAQVLVQAGHKEIVVSGVFLGAYGLESVRRRNWPEGRNDNLAELLDRLAKIPGLARIRLSSLEPADVTERLLDTLCSHPNIMPHLHLPLQSGSDAILKRMCRQYNVDQFSRAVDSLQTKLDRPAVTTDIIVGFPGETDADFEQTLSLARSMGFAKMHVFPFSSRQGTAAANMDDVVGRNVRTERTHILRDLDAELGLQYRGQFLGETAEVLVEDRVASSVQRSAFDAERTKRYAERIEGRSERYFKVYLDDRLETTRQGQTRPTRAARRISQIASNGIVTMQLVENRPDGMVGVVAAP